MLSEEQNRLLTQVGPGTPMGGLLRRYWHPIAGVSEFQTISIKPVRLFGEDLVLFKALNGKFGLVGRRCAHRGASLEYGFVEDDGIRCAYHGWCYDRNGAVCQRPFEETVAPNSAGLKSRKLDGYPVEEKAGMLWAYMGPQPVPLLPDWETFSWPNLFAQVVISEIPCNWLQCQENTVDPVHFEWMHNNTSQRHAGNFGPFSPKTLDLEVEDHEFGLVSRRYREGTDKSTPLWKIGRAILWPNGWYFGHHFEWKVPIDDLNTLYVSWHALHVPSECEPYVQESVPTWYGPIKDANGRWISSHVGNQDFIIWISQGSIADRTRESLGASDRGVAMLRRRLFDDLASIEKGGEPRGIIRDPERNVRIELPCLGREELMKGLPREKMLKHPVMGPLLRQFYSQAGQPEIVRQQFERAMQIKQTGMTIHDFVPQ